MIRSFADLIRHAAALPPKCVVVINPNNEETFSAIKQAHEILHTRFLLVGDQTAIAAGLSSKESESSEFEIIHCPDGHEALRTSIRQAREGKADILMKGGVDTSAMMKEVLREESGLRTGGLLSDVFVLEYPLREENRFVMITDGGVTLAPDLRNKVDLIRNAVEVAHALGNPNPRVAILSATELVLPNLPSTIDAAALSKMNERGQIKGCIVDGPLALDNAISPQAAEEKGITSPVAGRAEILVAANIETANSLAKSTTYFANLPLAHVTVGARIPILIPSRADKSEAKLLSVALGIVMSEHRTSGKGDD